MESFIFKNVSFSYPEQKNKSLKNVSFRIKQGEFILICGHSGCGKSTLLRHFKTCLSPHGELWGDIIYKGQPLSRVEARVQAQEIGFVMQSPDNQVVTDKVWHELAFGLESLGDNTDTIRRRVAEVAAFFGIENWFYKKVMELSGGQKQLLCLASVVAMGPQTLILDEPTSMLDPIAASEFIAMLGKINRELGITIILTEHRLEEVFPIASRVLLMENNEIVCDDIPVNVGFYLRNKKSGMFFAMPSAMQVWASIESDYPCPVTVCEGRAFLSALKEDRIQLLENDMVDKGDDQIVVDCDGLWCRYEKDLPDVLKGFNLTLHRGEFYSILGGNGTGKTTALKVIAGLQKSYRGSVNVKGKIALLPQNPQALFVKRTVREELYDILKGTGLSKENMNNEVAKVVTLCQLTDIIDKHPYDISGGEQQRTAIAKVLLTSPDVLLLDEPTKGVDAEYKVTFANIIRNLTSQGVTVLMVSHDVTFCAEYTHRCGLFFDGNIVAQGTPREFFSGNSFYTTPANRMARDYIENAVTTNDIITCCGGDIVKRNDLLEEIHPLPSIKTGSVNYKPRPLAIWRKIVAVMTGLVAFGVFLYATSITSLSDIVDSSGIREEGREQLYLYIILFAALLVLFCAIGRKSEPPVKEQIPKDSRYLSKRTIIASFSILFFVPITILTGVYYFDDAYYNIVAMLVLFECMLPFIFVFESRKPKVRELVTIAVLCSIGVAGRSLFFMLPQFKPVLALTIVSGVAFGGEAGFLVGAVTMLVSNIMFSQGPWTPWQMFAMGIIGFIAGILFRKGLLRRNRVSLAIYGAFSAVIIYGGIMNPASAFMFSSQSINAKVLITYYITGLPMDLIHAFGTVVFLLIASEPLLEKMDRIKVKYGMVE